MFETAEQDRPARPGPGAPAERPLGLGLAAVAVVLLVAAAGTYVAGRETIAKSRQVEVERAVLGELELVLSHVKDAETGQRGFLLTGEEAYLAPYEGARRAVENDLEALRARAAASLLAASAVADVERLARAKLEELDRTLDAWRGGDPSAALALARSGRGKAAMDALRQRIGALSADEERDLGEARATAARYTRGRTVVFLALTLGELALLFWVYRRFRAETRRRARSAAELAEQRELLQVTLASIGDGVIVTDTAGRITFMNAVAERETGWTLAEAAGRPNGEVFRIVNESTREPVESPIEKVLATGSIAGLANHTLLIRRDGIEVPIDDSGAPIRDAAGTLRGVVLVFRDILKSKQAQDELRAAKEASEAANNAKDRFVAVLSHELRTPLTPVLATLTAWEAGGELPETLRADLARVRRNVDLEVRLIDDLLDLTRIATGKMALAPRPIDVHEVVGSVIAMAEGDARAKEIAIVDAQRAERHHAFADPERLQQVFANVLKNAVKFSPQGSTIRIETETTADGRIAVQVIDQGIGMTPETLARLFEPFQQGSHDLVRSGGGLGLGMAISRALIEALGGTLSAKSDGPGQGSVFTVTLPIVPPPEPVEVPPAVEAAAPPARASGIRILLVEDHEDSSYAMQRVLQQMGHEVVARADVAGAMAALGAERFDLVLSDIGLPDGSGLDLVRALRAGSVQPDVPAIALTGFGMETDVARAREAGFDAHLTKPIDFGRLGAAVRTLAAGRPSPLAPG